VLHMVLRRCGAFRRYLEPALGRAASRVVRPHYSDLKGLARGVRNDMHPKRYFLSGDVEEVILREATPASNFFNVDARTLAFHPAVSFLSPTLQSSY
jgi:hypothetical protein